MANYYTFELKVDAELADRFQEALAIKGITTLPEAERVALKLLTMGIKHYIGDIPQHLLEKLREIELSGPQVKRGQQDQDIQELQERGLVVKVSGRWETTSRGRSVLKKNTR